MIWVEMEKSCMNTSTVARVEDAAESDQFPLGLSVLVVDDDKVLLKILEHMLRSCSYNVTICSQATVALNLLRERKGCFDIILSDVHMPDMDGFKLLELVGLEMDLPVIMMSADQRTSIVMKGIKHGACDYLIKPIREEQLKNLWQHVVRKKWNGNKEHERSGCLEDNDLHKRGNEDSENTNSANDGAEGTLKAQKKRSISKDDEDGEFENDDSPSSKKPRVVWSVELHQQFVVAVNQLGIDKAVPKRILELMNVPGLTRENVASHLQKFRLYLKRLSGVAQQQDGIPNSFSGTMDPNMKLCSSLGIFDIRALAASGQIPLQTLAALQGELLGRPSNLLLPTVDQPAQLQSSSLHGSNCMPVEHGDDFAQPWVKCQSSIPTHFPQSIVSFDDVSSGFGSWPSNSLGPVESSSKVGELNIQTNNIMVDVVQQQQQQQESFLPESSRSINVQPSCLVAPSRSSATFKTGKNSLFDQNSSFNRSSVIDYNLILSRPNHSSVSIRHASVGDLKGTRVFSGHPGSGSISPSSRSVYPENGINQQIWNSTTAYTSSKSGEELDRGKPKNIGFTGKKTCIPSRFAIDELEPFARNVNHGRMYAETDGFRVKEEPNYDFTNNANVGPPVLRHFTPNDLMGVLSE